MDIRTSEGKPEYSGGKALGGNAPPAATPVPHGSTVRFLVLLLTLALVATACGGARSGRSALKLASSNSGAAGHPFTLPEAWGTTWSYNELNPNFFYYLQDFVLLPLAISKPPSLTSYLPQLASHWTSNGRVITVNIRKDAVWQDGKPVTSSDVLTTLLLQGTNANPIWGEISNVTTPSSKRIVFDLKPHQGAAVALQNILALAPVPTSQYGRFVPPHLKQDLLTYNNLAATKGQQAAGASPQGKLIQATFTKVSKFSPSKPLGDGPFRLLRMNGSASILGRSTSYWGSRKVHVAKVQFINVVSNAAVYPGMFSHLYDWSTASAPFEIIDRWDHTSGSHFAAPQAIIQIPLLFNLRRYPLNMLKVRQAMAYLINRNKVNLAQSGGHPTYSWTRRPNGLPDPLPSLYLTNSERKQLNPYRTNPTKAEDLLRSAGFTKRGGHWFMPNGHAFTLSVIVPSGQNDSIAQMQSVAAQLSAAGIKVIVRELEGTTYYGQLHAGAFQLAWGWGGSGLDPLEQLGNILVDYAVQNLGAYKGQPGIGFGPMATVPGLGRVNVPAVLQAETGTVDPGRRMRQLTWDWTRLVNTDLPYLTLASKGQPVFYSSTHYTDWPSLHNPLWALIGYLNDSGIPPMMEAGFIRPRGKA